MSSQHHAACHLLVRLVPRLACAEPSSDLHRVCHASHVLHAVCLFLCSRRIPLTLSHLRNLIAGVMAASRCLPPAPLARTAPRLRRTRAEPSSNLHGVCRASHALHAACSVGSGRISLALSAIFACMLLVSSQPRAACYLLSRLIPRLACAEPSCDPHCLCHRSLTPLDTGTFGSYRASPALGRLLALLSVPCRPCAACHQLSGLTQRLACAEPSSSLHRVCHASAMRCMPPAL